MLFLIKFCFYWVFFCSGSFKSWWSGTKPLNMGSWITYWPPDTHGYPGGSGVVFSKDPGQLESRSVSVYSTNIKTLHFSNQNWIRSKYPFWNWFNSWKGIFEMLFASLTIEYAIIWCSKISFYLSSFISFGLFIAK